jgi:hypothetical protein
MPEAEVSRFTIAVFADAAWAERGLEALKHHGFPAEALSVLAKETPDSVALVQRAFGGTPARLVLPRLGTRGESSWRCRASRRPPTRSRCSCPTVVGTPRLARGRGDSDGLGAHDMTVSLVSVESRKSGPVRCDKTAPFLTIRSAVSLLHL